MSKQHYKKLPTIAKQAYFIKRLRDSGYSVDRMVPKFPKMDQREWTVLINGTIFCTCYVNNGLVDEINPKSQVYFMLDDGSQFVPGRFTIDTQSIEIFVTNLMGFGMEPINTFTKVSAPNR